MSRLLIHVEGQTEETFVNEVLAPHLCERGYDDVGARLVGNARQRERRGGICAWNAVRRDIIHHLKQDGCGSSSSAAQGVSAKRHGKSYLTRRRRGEEGGGGGSVTGGAIPSM